MPESFPDTAQDEFSVPLLAWYTRSARDLPWRRTRDPYAIWVSEMMLQQTQVATAMPFWTRWMEQFPTIADLAAAPLDDVLKAWQGLGYYARARNLHRAAQEIVAKHDGVFPTRYEEVLALPGIGPYTAGAICSIALGQDVPLVDANVIRVLCRYFGLHGDPKSPRVQDVLWDRAGKLIPSGAARAFNQAMMELGALVCVARPRCHACPVQATCAAFAGGNPERFPEFAPRPVFTSQTDVSALIAHPLEAGKWLIVQRPPDGLWGGLWEFPRVTCLEGESVQEAARRAAQSEAGVMVHASDTVLGTVRHGVTTRKITLRGIACIVRPDAPLNPLPPANRAFRWVTPEEAEKLALSSPQAKLLQQARQHLEDQVTQPSLF